MRRRVRTGLAVVAALLALAGCRARDNDPGPGGVTVGEARALDEAAQMLESRQQAPPTGSSSGTGVPSAPARTAAARRP